MEETEEQESFMLPDYIRTLWDDNIKLLTAKEVLIRENASVRKLKKNNRLITKRQNKFWNSIRSIYPEFKHNSLRYNSKDNTFTKD